MSNDIQKNLKTFVLQNLDHYIGRLMESRCQKEGKDGGELRDCMAVRRASIRVVEDDPMSNIDHSLKVAFETAPKEGLFGSYGSRQFSILFRYDGPAIRGELAKPQKSLIPGGDGAFLSCTEGSSYRNTPTDDSTSLDAESETNGDGRATDVGGTPDAAVEADSGGDATVDNADTQADTCQEGCEADLIEVAEDVPPTTELTDAVPEDAIQDAVAEVPEEITPADAADVADTPELPQDATADTAATPDVVVYDTGICQYFCDTGKTDATDALLPQDATPTETGEPPAGVDSKMCTGPAGTEKLFAPENAVAAACTNGVINALISGAKGCVAECGFYDNNVVLSTDPNNPVPFALNLFVPPQAPMQPYAITLALQSPLFANASKPVFPGFLGSSFVFVFKQSLYNAVGDILWEAQDKDANGNLKGIVQIVYQPEDFFFKKQAYLEITYVDVTGNKTGYRYPCDALPNPIINCTEVK